jgi:uncharacterized protein (TIGR03437 family)
MRLLSCCLTSLLCLPVAAAAATFGTVIPIGGQASDIALDEVRGVVYVANYTANRIDVVSTKTKAIQTSINVGAQPSSLSLSPDGRWLLITHFSNFSTPANGLTVLDLTGNGNLKRTFSFGSAPMGAAFGADGLALVVTATDFLLLDPVTGYSTTLDTISNVTPKTLPVEVPNFPTAIIRAAVGVSGDGLKIYGQLEAAGTEQEALIFSYDVTFRQVRGVTWTFSPPAGPRVVSVNQDGSRFLAAWVLFHQRGFNLAQFPAATGAQSTGSYVFDTARRAIYAQMPSTTDAVGAVPILQVNDSENLAVREQLKLAENLTGHSVLSSTGETMYSVSDSGLYVLPVGSLYQGSANPAARVVPSKEDVVFFGNWCDRKVITEQFTVTNPAGGKVPFTARSSSSGIMVTSDSATTPATIRVSVDLTQYQNNSGTVIGQITFLSAAAINVPPVVRVLVNNRAPDQRGTILNIPGKLVDVAADPYRNRFYVLRQDKNQVLVFDASNYRQITTLATGNTPMQMAITTDGNFLITGADNSQVAHVFNLNTLVFDHYIEFPSGHYPRSIAVSNNAILAACRVAGPTHTIDKISLWGVATTLPSLGVWKNDVDPDTALSTSPSGSKVLAVSANGKVMLYDANADTFVSARQDAKTLAGGYGALADDRFAAGSTLLNASLYPIQQFSSSTGISSGFAMLDQVGLSTSALDIAAAGLISKFDPSQAAIIRTSRLSEAPLLSSTATQTATGTGVSGFTRTLVPLANRNAIVSLSQSGVTILPWNYDVAVADPRIDSVVNAADGGTGVAPGGLISIYGRDLSAVNAATAEVPLPTLLADSCLTVNGTLVPMIMASPTRINAQLPVNASGQGTMILRTPSGVSNSFIFPIKPNAPAVFRTSIEGLDQPVASVVRDTNQLQVTLSNPIHTDDWVTIYLTGMGATFPQPDSGQGAPSDPLALAATDPVVTLGGTEIPVFFAGLSPGSVGLNQINVRVPFRGVPTGMEVPLTIKQGTSTTTVNVRVVN